MNRQVDFDKSLTAKIVSGNKDAFKAVYTKHWKGIFVIAFSFLKSKEEAEDAVQDIFVNFWTKRSLLSDQLDYKPYLFRLARNSLVNIVNSAVKKYTTSLSEIQEPGNNYIENEVDYKELSNLASKAISQLPPKRKIIFELKRKEGLDSNEIAHEMGISRAMVQRQLKLAKLFINKYMQSHVIVWVCISKILSIFQ